MINQVEDLARKAQDAMRVSGSVYRAGLEKQVYESRMEPGVQKVLLLAKEMRAKSLHDLASQTKEKFEANQATYQAWAALVRIIESGPKTVDVINQGD